MRLKCYHGTDLNNAEKILNKGFICKINEEHWLGNGIYFYFDHSLAHWWTSDPTNKFGVEIKHPAILECMINVDENEVIDLRKLEHYKKFADEYRRVFFPLYFKEFDGKIDESSKKLRCTFCDYIHDKFKCKAIVGTFNTRDQPYIPNYGFGFSEFNIQYFETQICIFEQSAIKDTKLCKEKESKSFEVRL